MLDFILEFEEAVGRVWDKFLNKKVTKSQDAHRVFLQDINESLNIFHRLLGGEKAKDIEATDKRFIKRDKTMLEKISFLGNEFYLPWQDEKSLYLPTSVALFQSKKENEMLYFWLVAMAAQSEVKTDNFYAQNMQASRFLTQNYAGFAKFYEDAVSYLAKQFEQLSFLKSLNDYASKDLLNRYPNPLWIYPAQKSSTKKQKNEDEAQPPQREQSNDKVETLQMKKKASNVDDDRETDGLLVFLPESLLSIFERINVDRVEDESFDENALYHAQDLDEIALGKKKANLNARIKMDLDLKHESPEIYPLGKGHFIDEWDYSKNRYLKNFVRIKPQVMRNLTPIALPKRLQKNVRKIQNELEMLELQRIKNDRLPYGDVINLDTWIDYKGHQNRSTHHQNFYTAFEKKTRDLATLILADASLSTEAGVTQEMRIIDVVKDSLMIFSQALQRLGDSFAIYSFSSLQNKKVYFNIIKNFKENYDGLIRARIDTMQPFYYTRMGAAIRESAKILDKQKAANKLLLIISDGKPNDEDRYDGRYGIEDTKKAIEEVQKKGITPFCITIDQEGKDYLRYLFGKGGYSIVKDAKKLPEVIPKVYINLTK
jgi:nitric oxide reductase NorD protein